jgi:hypothetical protein
MNFLHFRYSKICVSQTSVEQRFMITHTIFLWCQLVNLTVTKNKNSFFVSAVLTKNDDSQKMSYFCHPFLRQLAPKIVFFVSVVLSKDNQKYQFFVTLLRTGAKKNHTEPKIFLGMQDVGQRCEILKPSGSGLATWPLLLRSFPCEGPLSLSLLSLSHEHKSVLHSSPFSLSLSHSLSFTDGGESEHWEHHDEDGGGGPRQFNTILGLTEGLTASDYATCVKI